MANVSNIQILQDGPSNVVVKLTGTVDTSDVAANTALIAPSALSSMDHGGVAPTRLVIKKISYNIESALAVQLNWAATTPVPIATLVNSGDDVDACKYGGIWNNSGTGITGAITYSTQGWSAGAVLSFNVIIEMQKR